MRALAAPCMVLAASLRSSRVPSLALLCGFMLSSSVSFRTATIGAVRPWRSRLFYSRLAFPIIAIEYQGVRGYNAASGQFLLAAALPIVSRADVQPYIDPAEIPAILDNLARDRWRGRERCFNPVMPRIKFGKRAKTGRPRKT